MIAINATKLSNNFTHSLYKKKITNAEKNICSEIINRLVIKTSSKKKNGKIIKTYPGGIYAEENGFIPSLYLYSNESCSK